MMHPKTSLSVIAKQNEFRRLILRHKLSKAFLRTLLDAALEAEREAAEIRKSKK